MSEQNIRRPAEGVRVAIAQIAPMLGDVDANLARHRDAVARAREEGANVLVFSELALTGYRLEDAVPDVALQRSDAMMAEIAALSTEDLSVIVGFVEESRDHAFFNAATYYENGRIAYTHRKTYLPTYGTSEEQRYFARGRKVRAFDTSHGRASILICEDALHPTALTVAALDGAETIYVPSASPLRGVTIPGEADANARHWEGYLHAMARTLGVFIVYANRVGVEDGQTFWGGSEIIGPDGGVLVKAAYHAEDFVSAVLPEGAVRRRRIQAPLLRDEDMDLTINELERIRERVPARREERTGSTERGRDYRGPEDRGRDERPRGRGMGTGYGGRGPERDAPRGEHRPRWQPRDEGRAREGRGAPLGNRRDDRSSQDDRRPRRFNREDRGRFRDDKPQPPSRYRPERGERRSRPLGGAFQRPPGLPKDEDDE